MPNWQEVLTEIQSEFQRAEVLHATAVDRVRRKYLKQLYDYTGPNVIAYYSGWLSKPGVRQAEISDEDKNGFMAGHNRPVRTCFPRPLRERDRVVEWFRR